MKYWYSGACPGDDALGPAAWRGDVLAGPAAWSAGGEDLLHFGAAVALDFSPSASSTT